jgi:surface polysaccharide O-acyltransferase-like enzyme
MPFLFWSLVYLMLQPSHEAQSFPARVLGSLVEGASYHLWFVNVLLGAYLALPIIGPWARSVGHTGLKYFLVIWGLALVLGSLKADQWFVRAEAGLFTGYLGYLVLGYYLSILPVERLRWRWIGWSLLLAGTSLTFAGTAWLSHQQGTFCDDLFQYTTPNVAIGAVGLLMLLRADLLPNLDRWPTARQVMTECSYGVYLVHILVLVVLGQIGLTWRTIHPLVGIPLTTSACFVLSVLIVRAIRMLPHGDKFVG